MQIERTSLPGVVIVTPTRHGDTRGFFSESWNRQRMAEAGLTIDFVQDNHSLSEKVGTIRGLHFQSPPHAQAKLVRPDVKTIVVFTGSFDDVAKAKEATLATIAQGADVHVHVMNKVLPGIEQAAREKGSGLIGGPLPACGSDRLYIAYSRTGVGYLVDYAVKSYAEGTWKPGPQSFGLKAGPEASDRRAAEPPQRRSDRVGSRRSTRARSGLGCPGPG